MHDLTGSCQSCIKIIQRYPDFHRELAQWFFDLQAKHPDAHISCAGRGKIDQEVAFQRGASKAHYGQSAHNYNAALDFFELADGKARWDLSWFKEVIASELTTDLKWYGMLNAAYYELPHVEWSSWRKLVKLGMLKLVEEGK